jgi:hypothetical protein
LNFDANEIKHSVWHVSQPSDGTQWIRLRNLLPFQNVWCSCLQPTLGGLFPPRADVDYRSDGR